MTYTEQPLIPDDTPFVNGTFFAWITREQNGIEQAPGNQASSIKRTVQWLFNDRQLSRALETVGEISQSNPITFQEDAQNTALDAFRTGAKNIEDTFSDSTSGHPKDGNPRLRRLSAYTEPAPNAIDPDFTGLQIKPSHQIRKTDLAIVVLDPLRCTVDSTEKTRLYDEATGALQAYIGGSRPTEYSTDLIEVIRSTVVAHGYVEEHDENGNPEEWRLPFDEIACLKGLVTLLGPHAHSGYVRQGAVTIGDGWREIIVAASGQTSAFDELVARSVAREIVFNERLQASLRPR